ncbi:hypothetical protein SCHPADRAFT_829289 [Schizopora paradoxa]|uniref:Fe2OG dioxygenase domain-containing protein n=1 Tax=Schizopora paradoxa TaxID=27342 RepID=A0A0H2RLZ1_9AGAM|nr:hypothetical protein SCHPADRAFT_829289 [Schizopora paradoxa]
MAKASSDQSTLQFPSLASKKNLSCEVVEEDQIIIIQDALNEDECKRFIDFVEGLPLELTPPPKKGDAQRVNHRISISSPEFARTLFELFAPHLPSFTPYLSISSSTRNAKVAEPRVTHSFNSNIRLYKYTEGQYFGCHYDDSVKDPLAAGVHSEWTILIYLSGVEDGVVGGETVFYKGAGKKKVEIRPTLRRGSALLHKHGQYCLLHEGAPVLKGTKYVLRSDLMFLD